LVGKRLETMHSPYARRPCMVSALSSTCFREGSFVVVADGGSDWSGLLSVVRSLLRSVCTRAADDSVCPRTSSAH